jgi:hypothetical protein
VSFSDLGFETDYVVSKVLKYAELIYDLPDYFASNYCALSSTFNRHEQRRTSIESSTLNPEFEFYIAATRAAMDQYRA